MLIYLLEKFSTNSYERQQIEETINRLLCAGHHIARGLQYDGIQKKYIQTESNWALMRACDCVLVTGFTETTETQEQIEHAKNSGMEIFLSEHEIPELTTTEKKYPIQVAEFRKITRNILLTHIRKNSDYGSINISGVGEIGIVVRLWDKVARLMNLSGFKMEFSESIFSKPPVPNFEAIDDSFLDAAVYSILGLIYRKGKWGK